MPAERLAFALERIGPADWRVFERFAAEFLAVDYPSLRTMASHTGDRGRDGELYEVAEEPRVAVQYSVTTDWKSKIRSTVARLAETMPSVNEIIYVTNQKIGPAADSLVREIRRTCEVHVDIRDRSWFVERELTAPQREAASLELARQMVDPLLVERRVREHAPVLSNDEARTALLHLTLYSRDEASGKGLTKVCFESLVLPVLQESTAADPVEFSAIVSSVKQLLPAGFDAQIEAHVEGAIHRLVGSGTVKNRKKTRLYYMSPEHQEIARDKAAEYLLTQGELHNALVATIRATLPGLNLNASSLADVQSDLRVALESVLLRRGEAFAAAAKSGSFYQVGPQEVLDVVARTNRASGALLTDEQVSAAILEVLDRPTPGIRKYLQRLADAYTLFAFLRQSPDVQKVMVTIFSHGDIWLDTSIVLPLMAETLLDDPTERYNTALVRAVKDAGLRIFVTDGVVEEVKHHINRCVQFARTITQEWRSQIPFLSAAYMLSGRARAGFVTWVEQFRGEYSPEDDIREYLYESHGIERRSLLAEAEAAPVELRAAMQEIWHEAHERRRAIPGEEELDLSIRQRLVAHDVENAVGVIQLRKQAASSPLGYRYWWLTLDRIAFSLQAQLAARLSGYAPASPAISPDFMVQYLRLGPLRTSIERQLWAGLPVLTDFSRYAFLSKELVAQADDLRASYEGLDERVIRRRVRDELNRLRLMRGPASVGGIAKMQEEIKARLSRQQSSTVPPVS